MLDYKRIAKALYANREEIIASIDRYIAKKDDDLKKQLKDEGYADPKGTVKTINALEETIAGILMEQTQDIVDVLKELDGAEDEEGKLKEALKEYTSTDTTGKDIADNVISMYEDVTIQLANSYIKETEEDMDVSGLRKRTSEWFEEWGNTLEQLMSISTQNQLEKLIQSTIDDGTSIADLTLKIMEGGWRNEYYQARRVAVTEVLRAHSVAQEEAIQQSPASDSKEWRHTGAYKNAPRENHVAMDGQVVPKTEAFELRGRDGNTYRPMYPRDPLLPACETINCHCIHRGIANKDILGMSYEDRKKMQEDFVASDDKAWEKELDARNKAKAGVTPYNALEDFSQKTRKKQIKYIGGKTKMALYDAGLIDSEEMLKKVKNSTLQELADDGIFTVKQSVVNHSVIGTYKQSSKPYPNGRMVSGGHTQTAMAECTLKGIDYEVTGTFSNGVRIGNVPSSDIKIKRTESGQAWFPENWDEDKVRTAGTYVANNGKELIEGYRKTDVYDGVAVRVLFTKGEISTICPDLDQNLYVEGVEILD